MKKDIHPSYHEIKVVMTDGEEYMTRSTLGKKGEVLKLLVDSKNHPAYTGNHKMLDTEGRMDKFNKRYGR